MDDLSQHDERSHIRVCLKQVAEVWSVWYCYFPTNYTTAPRDMLDSLVLEFSKIQQPLPAVLEPTYTSVWNLLSATGEALEMRDESLDIQEFWSTIMVRAEALGEHIQRMQRLAQEPETHIE